VTPHNGESVWRNRDFVLLWAGRLVSTLGSGISAIGLPLLALATTGSPAKAGLIAAAGGVPYFLLAVPAGVYADRIDRKAILVTCDAGRAVTWSVVGIAVLTGHPPLWLLGVAAVLEGSFFVFHNVAMSTSLPSIVSRAQLPAAVAQNGVILGTSDLLGPAVGGALFQAGHAVPFLVDGVSYLTSIFSVLGLRTSLRPAGDQPRPNVRRDAREAFAFLMGQPVLRLLAAVGAVGDVLFGGIGLVLIVYAQRRAAASPAAIGAIFAVAAGASIVGSIAGVRLVRRVDVGRALVLSAVAGAALFPILAAAHTVTLIAAVWAGNVLVTNVANVGRDSFQLSKVPIDLLGRVNGLVELVSYGGLPLGTALSGFALAAFGPVRTVVFIAAGRVLLTAVLVARAGVRRATLA
jgi:hypothetical protein